MSISPPALTVRPLAASLPPAALPLATKIAPHAHRTEKRPAHPRRPRHADGRAAAPLLAADRRRERARQGVDQADPPARRGSRALSRPWRALWLGRPPLLAPTRRSRLRMGGTDWYPLQLSRL